MSKPRKWHSNPAPHRLINHGDRGADVKRWQQGLNTRAKRRGWADRTAVDGVAGKDSFRLWRKVRHEIGLPADHPPTVAAQSNTRWPATRSRKAKRRAQARRPKRPVAGQLTPNFHLSEFNCRDGTPVPSYMEPHLRVLCERVLEPGRARFGPAVVNSGYRHDRYNASIGGASQSYHVYELRKSQPAADHTYSRGRPSEWADAARGRLGSTGGVGRYASFCHADTRNYRSDWWG